MWEPGGGRLDGGGEGTVGMWWHCWEEMWPGPLAAWSVRLAFLVSFFSIVPLFYVMLPSSRLRSYTLNSSSRHHLKHAFPIPSPSNAGFTSRAASLPSVPSITGFGHDSPSGNLWPTPTLLPTPSTPKPPLIPPWGSPSSPFILPLRDGIFLVGWIFSNSLCE